MGYIPDIKKRESGYRIITREAASSMLYGVVRSYPARLAKCANHNRFVEALFERLN
jgi:hypothetical protein